MQNKNWTQVKRLLHKVLALKTAERSRYFQGSDDPTIIRAEVESLLGFEKDSERLMQLSDIGLSKALFDAAEDRDALIGQHIGVYRIVSELGHGGMGAVYLAERADGKFDQRVALKLLKREMNTSALRRRFQQEREILASLDHPNISRLLDAGATDDKIPFLAMEYVEGLPIDEYCQTHELGLRACLDIFLKVCSAVDFAHRNLVVHRDLKPSNILVTADGMPKLLDFGISKILSSELESTSTVTKLGVMTPGYASPEQLRNESVTTATDVYSLGVILYELLSGHRPFEAKENDFKAIYKAVLETEPPLPSGVWRDARPRGHADTEDNRPGATGAAASPTRRVPASQLLGDLDNIVLKALRKEPERRYSSAENLADDIRRHQDGLPVTARPNTFSYRTEKFIGRNRASVAAAALILLAIIGGIAATLWQARVARAERTRAERRFNDVRTLANSFLFEFSPLVENLPGSTPARKLLVTRALEYLDNLSQESAGDIDLQRELAKAYEKVGDVQGNPYNPNIGDQKGALDSYEKALAIRQGFLDKDPENLTAQDDVANIVQLIADIQSNGGDYAKALGSYEKAVAMREERVRAAPTDYDARAKLAKLLRLRGLIPFFEGDNKEAIEYYNRAKDIYEGLRAERPDDDKIAHEYSYMFVAIGEAQGWDDMPELAAEYLQKGLDMLIPLGEKYPNDQTIRRSLNLAYSKRGENYDDAKAYDKSVASFTKALELALTTYNVDPQNFQSKRDAAIGYKKLAQSLDLAGKSMESVEKLNLAIKTFQELSATDPNNAEVAYDVANTRFSLGETYLTLKDYDSSLKTFLTAKEGFERVLQINPTNKYAARMGSYNHEGIGKSYVGLAEKGNKRESLQMALENFRAAHAGLIQLKAAGNLAEHDLEPLDEMGKKIKEIEGRIGT